MFVGESTHTMDAKGRVFVPKRFQEVLEQDGGKHTRAVLTRGFEGCLFLFTASGFQSVLGRLLTQAFGGEELRKMQRLFFSNTHPCQLDTSGRLSIPEGLKKLAALEEEIVMVGCADRAEIWSKARWEGFKSASEAEFDRLSWVLCGDGQPSAAAREQG